MDNLKDILLNVDWVNNINSSLSYGDSLPNIDQAILRIAVWAKQLEILDTGNPALPFVRDLQSAAHSSGALIGLCLYKPSAASTRNFFESALYYSYFRTHPEELATLSNDTKYYLTKSDIIEYHKQHTVGFKYRQVAIGFLSKLDEWYAQISAVVHGQIPGSWIPTVSLESTAFCKSTQDNAIGGLLSAVALVDALFFCTVAQNLWTGFAPDVKEFLLKGMAGAHKIALNLDSK